MHSLESKNNVKFSSLLQAVIIITREWLYTFVVGLDRTGHMSFMTGQDRTPKFAGRILPDRTKSGLTFLNTLYTKYDLLIIFR